MQRRLSRSVKQELIGNIDWDAKPMVFVTDSRPTFRTCVVIRVITLHEYYHPTTCNIDSKSKNSFITLQGSIRCCMCPNRRVQNFSFGFSQLNDISSGRVWGFELQHGVPVFLNAVKIGFFIKCRNYIFYQRSYLAVLAAQESIGSLRLI